MLKRDADAAAVADAGAAAPPAKKFVLERGTEPVLGLLAALGVPREHAMETLAEGASARIIAAVPSLPPRRRMQLLVDSFPHVDSPRLRSVAIAASTRPSSPLLSALIGPQQALLSHLPLAVQQRVWETESPPSLFLKATHDLVIALQGQLAQSFARAAQRDAAEVPPKQRESAALRRLVELFGSMPLYAALARLCGEIYDGSGGAGPTKA